MKKIYDYKKEEKAFDFIDKQINPNCDCGSTGGCEECNPQPKQIKYDRYKTTKKNVRQDI